MTILFKVKALKACNTFLQTYEVSRKHLSSLSEVSYFLESMMKVNDESGFVHYLGIGKKKIRPLYKRLYDTEKKMPLNN